MAEDVKNAQTSAARPPLLPGSTDKSRESAADGPKDSPETISQIIHALADRADPLVKIIAQFGERLLNAQEAKARFSIRMSLMACGVVTVIVIVAGILTYTGKIDGSTFTFLLGLVVGYILTFIRDSIQPPKSQ